MNYVLVLGSEKHNRNTDTIWTLSFRPIRKQKLSEDHSNIRFLFDQTHNEQLIPFEYDFFIDQNHALAKPFWWCCLGSGAQQKENHSNIIISWPETQKNIEIMCICRVLGSSIAQHSWLGSDTHKRSTEAIWALSFVRSETQKSLGYILNMKCFRSEHTTNNWDPFGLWHQRHKPIYEHMWTWCIGGSKAQQSRNHLKITVLLRSTKTTEIMEKWRLRPFEQYPYFGTRNTQTHHRAFLDIHEHEYFSIRRTKTKTSGHATCLDQKLKWDHLNIILVWYQKHKKHRNHADFKFICEQKANKLRKPFGIIFVRSETHNI